MTCDMERPKRGLGLIRNPKNDAVFGVSNVR